MFDPLGTDSPLTLVGVVGGLLGGLGVEAPSAWGWACQPAASSTKAININSRWVRAFMSWIIAQTRPGLFVSCIRAALGP